MKKDGLILGLSFSIILLSACQKEEVGSIFVDVPVVEAYLHEGNGFELLISRQVPFSEDAEYSTDDIDDLDITITSNGSVLNLTPSGSGVYLGTNVIVEEHNQYDLSFNYNGQEVTATTVIPARPAGFEQSVSSITIEESTGGFGGGITNQPDPIDLSWNNPDGSYYLIVIENIESNPEPIRDFGDGEAPAKRFRDEPTLGDSYQLNSRQISYYGTHSLVLFHLNPDYASLYDDGETTSQNLTTPSTGIENGVGIFTGMSSDTLWLEVKK